MEPDILKAWFAHVSLVKKAVAAIEVDTDGTTSTGLKGEEWDVRD
jgi:hypothetical protein